MRSLLRKIGCRLWPVRDVKSEKQIRFEEEAQRSIVVSRRGTEASLAIDDLLRSMHIRHKRSRRD